MDFHGLALSMSVGRINRFRLLFKTVHIWNINRDAKVCKSKPTDCSDQVELNKELRSTILHVKAKVFAPLD